MNRRKLNFILGLGGPLLLSNCSLNLLQVCGRLCSGRSQVPLYPDPASYRDYKYSGENQRSKSALKDKSIHFDQDFLDDVFLSQRELLLAIEIVRKLRRLQSYIGYGNFNIINWDKMVIFGKNNSQIGEFNLDEKKFLERLYYFDAFQYGFMGKKVFTNIDSSFSRKDVHKVPYSGHYLLKDQSLSTYNKLKKEMGAELVLTSGVRGVVKQFTLFLAKAVALKGNLSRASRSIAPPGYSFHGKGDFDIGQIGLGVDNFTNKFSETKIYQRLGELNQSIRYNQGNFLGVRFEPWHIRVQ